MEICARERKGAMAGQDGIRCVCVFVCLLCVCVAACMRSEMISMDKGARRRGGCSFVTEQLLCGTLLMSGHLCMYHHGAAPCLSRSWEMAYRDTSLQRQNAVRRDIK